MTWFRALPLITHRTYSKYHLHKCSSYLSCIWIYTTRHFGPCYIMKYIFLVTYSTRWIYWHKYSAKTTQSCRSCLIFLLNFSRPSTSSYPHLLIASSFFFFFCTPHIPAIIYTADYCPCLFMIKDSDKMNTAIKWIKASSISSQRLWARLVYYHVYMTPVLL